jgi:hypothetical protein
MLAVRGMGCVRSCSADEEAGTAGPHEHNITKSETAKSAFMRSSLCLSTLYSWFEERSI